MTFFTQLRRNVCPLLSSLVVASVLGCSAPEGDRSGIDLTTSSAALTNTTLFDELWGSGAGTVGGLNGQVYVVDRADDSGDVGSLRYGVESLSGPT